MRTKNVVIAMFCASIVILSIAAPISAVELKNSGISGEIDGTGEVTGSVSLETSIAQDGTADVEASIEVSVDLNGPGSAKASQEGPVTDTVETDLGTIVADVSADSNVNAAVEVVGEGSASADAYVGTYASLGESEVLIVSEISSETDVKTNGGSASATASATGTTTGDGISYATGCPPAENDATSHAEVSGDTEANVVVSGTAEAGSYAVVRSIAYAEHYAVHEESYIGSDSYASSDDDNCKSYEASKASADSSANGEAYQYGQAENCASSDTYAEGKVSTAVETEGHADAESDAYIRSWDSASSGTRAGANVLGASDIDGTSKAGSDTDGKASAKSSSIGYTGAAGSACDCVHLDTSAIGIVSTGVQTQGNADAESNVHIDSSGSAYNRTDDASVSECTYIAAMSDTDSGTDGKASAGSSSIGYAGVAGSACDCVYSDTSVIGIVFTGVQTQGNAHAGSNDQITSGVSAYNRTDGAYVEEASVIWTGSYANSDTDGKASAGSASKGYTGAAGSACGCVYSDTYAIGIVSTAVHTEGPAYAESEVYIWSDDEASKDTDEAYVDEHSVIDAWSEADSGTDGKASAGSASKGYTGATGSACECLDSWTNAKGAVQVKTETDGDAWIFANARLTSEGWIVIGEEMGAKSVINTSATAMHNSNSAGTATADGSTEAGASNSCTDEWVGTGILGKGETIVNPFNVMSTNTYAGFAYANAIPVGFEDIDFNVHIDTTGPNEAYSFTEATAMIPAPP